MHICFLLFSASYDLETETFLYEKLNTILSNPSNSKIFYSPSMTHRWRCEHLSYKNCVVNNTLTCRNPRIIL